MSHQNSEKMMSVMRGSGDKVIRDYSDSDAMSTANVLNFAWAAIGTECNETRKALLDLIGVTEGDVVSALDPFKSTNHFAIHKQCRENAQIAILSSGSASYLH